MWRALLLVLVGCAPVAPIEDVTDTTSPAPSSANAPSPKTPSSSTASSVVVTTTSGDALPVTQTGAWTWFGPTEFNDVPTCMDGSKTGLGVNASPTGSKKVLLLMNGGGACFDGQTCAISDLLLSADHANEDDFGKWATSDGIASILDRTEAKNPFKDWNYVFVPYCSGDVFSGNTASGFAGRPQVGFENVAAYLPRLAATFRQADQIVLSGTSAGGYGALYNYVQVQKVFDWVDVSVIDDSGPPFSSKTTNPCLQEQWRKTWNMDATSPVAGPFPLGFDPGTGKAEGGLLQLVNEVLPLHPKSQFAFLSHQDDLVMRYFHGIGETLTCNCPGLMGSSTFEAGLREVAAANLPNFSTFYGPGDSHQYFTAKAGFYDVTSSDGVALADWLGRFVTSGAQPKHVPAGF